MLTYDGPVSNIQYCSTEETFLGARTAVQELMAFVSQNISTHTRMQNDSKLSNEHAGPVGGDEVSIEVSNTREEHPEYL